MILVDQIIIVEIATHLPGRIHRSIDVKLCSLRERREIVGQHASLYFAGHLQLSIQPLLLHLFPVLHFKDTGFPSDIPHDADGQHEHGCNHTGNIECSLLIKGFLLYDLHGIGFAGVFERVLHVHGELIGSARQVRIHHRCEVFPAHGCGPSVKSLHLVGDIRIRERVIEHVAAHGQLVNMVRNMIGAVCFGIDPGTVRFQIGNGYFQTADIFHRCIDIYLRHTPVPCDIQIALRSPFAVGVAGGNAGKPVCQAVMDR